MRSRDFDRGIVGNKYRVVRWCALLGLWLGVVSLQGCARGDLELLIDDIKRFYLNGGFHGGASDKMSVSAPGALEADPAEEALLKIVIEQAERYANVQRIEGSPSADSPQGDASDPLDTDLR